MSPSEPQSFWLQVPVDAPYLVTSRFNDPRNYPNNPTKKQLHEGLDLNAVDGAGRPVAVSDFAARRLAPSVVLLTYRATADGVATLRSSIWRRAGDCWQMMFHQGTPSAPQPDEP